MTEPMDNGESDTEPSVDCDEEEEEEKEPEPPYVEGRWTLPEKNEVVDSCIVSMDHWGVAVDNSVLALVTSRQEDVDGNDTGKLEKEWFPVYKFWGKEKRVYARLWHDYCEKVGGIPPNVYRGITHKDNRGEFAAWNAASKRATKKKKQAAANRRGKKGRKSKPTVVKKKTLSPNGATLRGISTRGGGKSLVNHARAIEIVANKTIVLPKVGEKPS